MLVATDLKYALACSPVGSTRIVGIHLLTYFATTCTGARDVMQLLCIIIIMILHVHCTVLKFCLKPLVAA